MARKERTDATRIFWGLLLLASLIAAGVSLLTTGLGLNRYVSFPLAWSLAVAVQLGLFGLAWLIGVGRDVPRGLVSALYCVTMLFSVTFSYVTLQSEFTREIRPAEARRRLFDQTRTDLAETLRLTNAGVAQSEDLKLRLKSWVDMERREGWATRTCEEAEHCYLRGVCDRIRRRISRWEAETGKAYREGPGEKLIYGTLTTELHSLDQLGRRLTSFRDQLTNGNGVLERGIDNRARLERWDGVLAQAPLSDLAAMSCRDVALPQPPAYEENARDDASSGEQPVYAFSDLMALLSSDHDLRREDYPTIFALCLAVFIDVFVLLVALGASLVHRHPGREPFYRELEAAPRSWEEALRQDIAAWVDGALLAGARDPEARRRFLRTVVEAITFSRQGEARLIPEGEDQKRFAHLLAQAGAARIESFVKYNRIGRMFLLEDWVYPALTRHLTGEGAATA